MPNAEERLRRRHSGRRVLLVEDNLVNREVAEELLRYAGLIVESADNGAIGLQLCASNSYDVVLMDIMMPVMGGIEAAQKIRQLTGHSPPIIAMTANAFDEDRRASLQAGMNDHITKPVDPNVLYGTLLRWLPLHATPLRERPTLTIAGDLHAPDHGFMSRLEHVADLHVEVGLQNVGGRIDTFARVLARFADTYQCGVPLLLGPGDMDHRQNWRRACHSLAGACATVGALRLAALASEIDRDDIVEKHAASLSESGLLLQTELVALSRALAKAL